MNKFIIALLLPFILFGQIPDKKMVTFFDLDYMITNDGFTERNSFNHFSLQCPNKLEVIDALVIDSSILSAYSDDQLIPREAIYYISDYYNLTNAANIYNEQNTVDGCNHLLGTAYLGSSGDRAYDGIVSIRYLSNENSIFEIVQTYPSASVSFTLTFWYYKTTSTSATLTRIIGATREYPNVSLNTVNSWTPVSLNVTMTTSSARLVFAFPDGVDIYIDAITMIPI